jgi:hypothetical protein
MLRALKRNEVVAMQLDRPLGGDGARLVDFFGAPAWFQAGPAAARPSRRAPIFPVFALRVGARHYRIVSAPRQHLSRHATIEETDRILESIVGEFETTGAAPYRAVVSVRRRTGRKTRPRRPARATSRVGDSRADASRARADALSRNAELSAGVRAAQNVACLAGADSRGTRGATRPKEEGHR